MMNLSRSHIPTTKTIFFESDSEEDDDFPSVYRERVSGGFSILPGLSIGSSLQPSFSTWNSSCNVHESSAEVHRKGSYDRTSLIAKINGIISDSEKSILHAVEVLSASVTQLERRTYNLENSMDDLKVCAEYNNGRTGRKLKELECVLKEVHEDVESLLHKQEIAETELSLQKLQHEAEKNDAVQTNLPYQNPYLEPNPYPSLPHLNNLTPEGSVVVKSISYAPSHQSYYSNLVHPQFLSNPPPQQFKSYAESGWGQEQSTMYPYRQNSYDDFAFKY